MEELAEEFKYGNKEMFQDAISKEEAIKKMEKRYEGEGMDVHVLLNLVFMALEVKKILDVKKLNPSEMGLSSTSRSNIILRS